MKVNLSFKCAIVTGMVWYDPLGMQCVDHDELGVQQTETADLQLNEENFVVECFNRVPIPKV